jgi:hypothetical protein
MYSRGTEKEPRLYNTKNAENAVFLRGGKRQENEQVTLRDAEQLGKR